LAGRCCWLAVPTGEQLKFTSAANRATMERNGRDRLDKASSGALRRAWRPPLPLQIGPGIEPAFPHSEKNFLKRLQLVPGIWYISSEQLFSL
jgi:hypothetical protein